MSLIIQEIITNIDKWICTKSKSFCTAKDTIVRVKKHSTASYSSNRGIIFKIYKELKKCSTKRTNNAINKWARELKKHF
jgi:hypothetical protein